MYQINSMFFSTMYAKDVPNMQTVVLLGFLFVCLCHVSDCVSSMYTKDSNKSNPERNSVFLQQCVSSLPSNSALAKYKKSIEDNFKAVKRVMSDEDQQDQPLPDQLREWSVLSAVSPLSEWFLSVVV